MTDAIKQLQELSYEDVMLLSIGAVFTILWGNEDKPYIITVLANMGEARFGGLSINDESKWGSGWHSARLVSLPPPDGYRWLEIGEILRAGDKVTMFGRWFTMGGYNETCKREYNYIRKIEQATEPDSSDLNSTNQSCDTDSQPNRDAGNQMLPEGYRFLKVGETLRIDDKYYSIVDQRWTETSDPGRTIQPNDFQYCRKIEPPTIKESLQVQPDLEKRAALALLDNVYGNLYNAVDDDNKELVREVCEDYIKVYDYAKKQGQYE